MHQDVRLLHVRKTVRGIRLVETQYIWASVLMITLPSFQNEEVELLTIAHSREMKGIQNRWRKEIDTSPSESER